MLQSTRSNATKLIVNYMKIIPVLGSCLVRPSNHFGQKRNTGFVQVLEVHSYLFVIELILGCYILAIPFYKGLSSIVTFITMTMS
jgi:hypothetical protein